MDLREEAKKYIKLGYTIFPTKKDKSPDIYPTWVNGTKDINKFKNIFGIGLACGSKSSGVVCIDIDNHQGDAKKRLADLINTPEVKLLYKKYKLPIESTQGGGFHLFFRSNKTQANKKLASAPKYDKKTNKTKPDAFIETKGEGGYVVIAPTEGYVVVRNNLLEIPLIDEEEHNIIINISKSFNEFSDIQKQSYENTDKPGDLFNQDPTSIAESKNILKSNGWVEIDKYKWRRPDKSKGISATFGKVADNVFYVFSSNAHPFEPDKAYTPFQILSLLEYNGNFSDCAKELSTRYQSDNKYRKDYEKKVIKKTEIESLMNKCHIDRTIKIEKPPIIMRILGEGLYNLKLFSLGNFSAIIGKSKSKKTYLTTLFLASAVKNGIIENKFESDIPEGKRAVISFDTEQSMYDAQSTAKRIDKMVLGNNEHYIAFGLRELTQLERCELIEYVLDYFKNTFTFVLIDGIADLARGVNDEDEANRVLHLLLKWTTMYYCHIQVIIHQNKQDNFAKGWLGSKITEKSEIVISAEKDTENKYVSKITCQNIRGEAEFSDFYIGINHESKLPEVVDIDNLVDNTDSTIDSVNF